MNAQLLLAIDVGTQSTRAIVFDAAGHLIARAQVVYEPSYRSPQPGWAEQDVEVYWRAVIDACQMLWQLHQVPPASIAGVSLTTQRDTMVCCDAQGRALRPAIVWLDQRRASRLPPLGAFWNTAFAVAGARSLITHFQRESEANWLSQHEPALWSATDKFLFLSGWLTRRLVGDFVDSSACQVGFVPFDYKRLQWAGPRDFKWRAIDVRPAQLPRLIAPGALLGQLLPSAAAELGLAANLPLIAAAADKACEVLGSGALAADTAALSFGTSATINTTQSRYLEVQRLLPAYPAASPGAWNTEIQIHRGFWMVSWFKREFAHREQALALERGVAVESLFDELIDSVPPGALGLTLQAYWSPGVLEPDAKGAIVGFGDVHTRAHLYRAILEGLAYGLRSGKEQTERKLGFPLRRVIAAGGGSQSDAAMQITADVFAQTIERPEVYESSALGAAINLAVGLGVHANHAQAVAAMTRSARSFEPDATTSRIYDELYREVYRELYPRLSPLYRRIRRITGYPG